MRSSFWALSLAPLREAATFDSSPSPSVSVSSLSVFLFSLSLSLSVSLFLSIFFACYPVSKRSVMSFDNNDYIASSVAEKAAHAMLPMHSY